MQGGKSRLVECIAHDHQLLGRTEGNRSQLRSFTECTGTDLLDRIRKRQGHDMGICKGLFRDLGQANARFKCQRGNAAVLKCRVAQSLQACGKCNALQLLRIFKGRPFDGDKG